ASRTPAIVCVAWSIVTAPAGAAAKPAITRAASVRSDCVVGNGVGSVGSQPCDGYTIRPSPSVQRSARKRKGPDQSRDQFKRDANLSGRGCGGPSACDSSGGCGGDDHASNAD